MAKIHKIDKARYWEMLEVLPPENWVQCTGFEHFRMMEYSSGTLTTSFGKMGEQYIEKQIDVCDRSTWITAADFTTN